MDKITDAINVITDTIQNKRLHKAVLSSPFAKSEKFFKIIIELKQAKDSIFYQMSQFYETKVTHKNFDAATLSDEFSTLLYLYGQIDIFTDDENIKILVNKNQTCKILRRKTSSPSPPEISKHDKTKNYIISQNEPVGWLCELGIMSGNGAVYADKQKKFKQINRFLEMIDDIAPHIPDDAVIIDVGCGKSYLSFAIYYYFNVKKGKNISVTGLDIKNEVVADCNHLAEKSGFERLRFYCENIENFNLANGKADMVVTLHACDTATDYALYNAVKWNAKVIMSVPCCQHELLSQVNNEIMNPLLKHGVLKERFSSLLTDSLRAELLASCGYKSIVMEFVDMEHTPKNILIRATKNSNKISFDPSQAYKKMANEYRVEPMLFKLLKTNFSEGKNGI